MKKINSILLSLSLLLSASLSAQVDLAITAITAPADNSTFISGLLPSPQLGFSLTNQGTVAIDASNVANLKIRLSVNGATVTTYNMNASFTLAAGATSAITTPAVAMATLLTLPSNQVCLVAEMVGDVNNSNDSTCNTYNVTTATIDIKSESVVAATPAPGAGNTFDLGTVITQLDFTMRNNSSVDLPTGTTIPYTLSVGGTANNVTGSLASNWVIGTTTTRNISNPAIIAALPTVLGPFEICAWTRVAGAKNDTTCTTYTMTGIALTSFTPANGKCGETVTINGANFDPVPANNTVKFRGVAAEVLTASATKLTVKVPETANGKIKVEVGTKSAESAATFTYDGCDVVTNPDGVSEIENKFGKIYYSNNNLNIVTNADQTGSKLIQIVNIAGQTVFEEVRDLQGNNVEVIDLSTSPNGMYIVNIEGYSKTFVK